VPTSFSVDYCSTVLTNIENEFGVSVFSDSEIDALKRFQSKVINTANNAALFWSGKGGLIILCTLKRLQGILSQRNIQLQPAVYYNGETGIDIEVQDLGHSGMQYPCPPPVDANSRAIGLPDDLLWEHCLKTVPVVNQVVRISVPVQILAVNNLPSLNMYDANGLLYPVLPPLNAVQNVTLPIPRLEVFDPDISETPNALMQITIQVLMGGTIDCNVSRAPKLKASFNFARNQMLAIGSIDDINTVLRTVVYRSDPDYIGVEGLYVDVDDNGYTGAALRGRGAVQFRIDITVEKPKACQFATCEECVATRLESCGWCPSSCGGRGKCREALTRGGPPRYGTCAPYCEGGVCMQWNMCFVPTDRSYLMGAIGAPLIFLLLLSVHFLIMWARQLYGTVPIYVIKCTVSLINLLHRKKLIPPETAKNTQLLFLYIFAVVAGLLPSIGGLFEQPPLLLDLGEVSYLRVKS
jgi:hypothetical protein